MSKRVNQDFFLLPVVVNEIKKDYSKDEGVYIMTIKDITFESREILPVLEEKLNSKQEKDSEYEALKKGVDVCRILSSFNYEKSPSEITVLKKMLPVLNALKKNRDDLVANYAYSAFYELSHVLAENELATKQYDQSKGRVMKKYDKLAKLNTLSLGKEKVKVYVKDNKNVA